MDHNGIGVGNHLIKLVSSSVLYIFINSVLRLHNVLGIFYARSSPLLRGQRLPHPLMLPRKLVLSIFKSFHWGHHTFPCLYGNFDHSIWPCRNVFSLGVCCPTRFLAVVFSRSCISLYPALYPCMSPLVALESLDYTPIRQLRLPCLALFMLLFTSLAFLYLLEVHFSTIASCTSRQG